MPPPTPTSTSTIRACPPGRPGLPRARRALAALLCAAAGLAPGAATAGPALPAATALETLAADVRAAETAFALSMAERSLARFAAFVAEDAAFRGRTLRIGRDAVIEGWRGYFDGAQAPFSWSPDAVTAGADGRTAISTGLVRDPQGAVIGRFTSVWRKDDDGRWRVVVDQGVDACDCAAAKPP